MEIPIQKIGGEKRDPLIQISANVKHKIWQLAKDSDIGWTEALEFGILFLLAEKDGGMIINYPKNKLTERLQNVVTQLNAKCQECEAIRVQLESRRVSDENK